MMDDIEALIKLAQSEDTKQEAGNLLEKEVIRFIRIVGVKVGYNPVAMPRIYDAYRRFKTKDYLSKIQFSREFKKYFEWKLFSNIKYFYLDPVPLGLPETYTIYTDSKIVKNTTGKSYGKANKRRKKELKKQVADPEQD